MSAPSASELSPLLVLPGTRGRSGRPVRRRHRLTAVLLAVVLIAGITLSGGGAGAQSVESLRDRAQALADELDDLEQRSNELNEEYLELSERLAVLEDEQESNRGQVREAEQRVEAARGEAAGYLVEAYVGAGVHDGMAQGSSDPNDAVNSRVLLEYLRDGQSLAADEYEASRSDLAARSAELEATSKELAAAKERQGSIVADLQAKVDRHDELLNSANAELNAALEAERRRREAAEAARARAEQERAAAAATSNTSNTSTETSDDRPSVPDRPNRPGPGTGPTPPPPPRPDPPTPPVSPPNGRAATAVSAALSRLGTPYRWGGTTPAGFDCSGLMLWSWAQAGVGLPRTSRAQRSYTQRISAAQLQPGDLVFSGNPVSHVGMYIGGGQMVHSPHTGDVVKISPLRSGGSVSYGRVP